MVGIETAVLDSEVLLANVLDKDRPYLYTDPTKNLAKKQEWHFRRFIARRSRHEPVAYLINEKEFFGLKFYVDKRVLIPRPETEILVEEILKLKKIPRTIADIGVGSGCVSVTLAKYLPKTKIFAIDISVTALACAQKNIKKFQAKNVDLLYGDMLEPLQGKVDAIVTNLPYISTKKLKEEQVSRAVRFEPKIALNGGPTGLELYKKMFAQARAHLNKEGLIIIEIDEEQQELIKDLIGRYFPRAKVSFKKDLAGYMRAVKIQT